MSYFRYGNLIFPLLVIMELPPKRVNEIRCVVCPESIAVRKLSARMITMQRFRLCRA